MQFIFSGKNYFDSTWCIIRTSKYLAKKKNYYCKEHKFSLMLTGLFILFIKATTTTFPLVTLPPSPPLSFVDHGQHARHRPELYASLPYYAVMAMWALARSSVSSEPQSKLRNYYYYYYPIISLPVTLRTTNTESEKIATSEVEYRTSRTHFTPRIA